MQGEISMLADERRENYRNLSTVRVPHCSDRRIRKTEICQFAGRPGSPTPSAQYTRVERSDTDTIVRQRRHATCIVPPREKSMMRDVRTPPPNDKPKLPLDQVTSIREDWAEEGRRCGHFVFMDGRDLERFARDGSTQRYDKEVFGEMGQHLRRRETEEEGGCQQEEGGGF